MKIFEIDPDCDKYEGMTHESYKNSNYKDGYNRGYSEDLFLTNSPVIENWTSINLLSIDDKYKGKKSDYPNFYASAPLFSTKAKDILFPYLNKLGIFYEFIVNNQEKYYCFKITNQLDQFLDHVGSSLKYFSNSNRIMSIKSFIFNKDARNTFIFRIPELNAPIFCNEEFKKVIEQHKLKGFVFSEIGEYKI
ncbi:MAG: hypothetical protein COB02_15935 [Candidatus Cloacimonadota bacterium]|nr:MAG: hypothetical protein COB02_15935 [Candidatus Cloacimonadota bacterium]